MNKKVQKVYTETMTRQWSERKEQNTSWVEVARERESEKAHTGG